MITCIYCDVITHSCIASPIVLSSSRCHSNMAWMNSCISFFNVEVITYPWASYQIRKIAGCACAGNDGNVFPCRRFQRKPLVSDPGMHHGTCVTHVPWCMSGSLTCGDGGKRSRHSRRMRTRNFAYLARGPCYKLNTDLANVFKQKCNRKLPASSR